MKRLIFPLVFITILGTLPLLAEPYCGVEDLPDLIKCLPPPEPGSA